MREIANFCDYFVICTGKSDTQGRAIVAGIREGLNDFGIKIRAKEGLKHATWVILDVGDIVAHVFTPEAREFYDLEHLWQDAKSVEWKE